jgi:thioredoxin
MNGAPATSPRMKLRAMNEAEFAAEVLAAPQTVLVDFATSWCAPCRALAPILRAVAAERGGQLSVATIDAEASQALARRYDVRSFPTVIAFAGGREVARTVGLTSKERLIERLRLPPPVRASATT